MRFFDKVVRKFTRRRPTFLSDDVIIGQGVQFGENVVFNCKRVRIGDGAVIGNNVTVNVDVFEVGDFCTIYDGCFFPGPGEIRVGHNFWLGGNSIIDGKGGTSIGNNVGVGAHSQLWTHMVFGDVMYGCRFHSQKQLTIGNDVWLVGHCLVSPVTIGDRSLVMLGSLVTKDIEADRTFAGSPAKDITERAGSQFGPTTTVERKGYLNNKIGQFFEQIGASGIGGQKILIVDNLAEFSKAGGGDILIDVESRQYRKTGTALERRFIRFLLPDVKLTPASSLSE